MPRALPPKSIRFGYVDDRIKALNAAQDLARDLDVEVSVIVKIAHRVYDVIQETLEEEKVEALILGGRGERFGRRGRILGSNIDFVVHVAKCDVIVFKGLAIKEKFERITVLSGHTRHVIHATEVAALLAKEQDAEITILTVIPERSVEEAAIADGHRLIEMLEGLDVKCEHKIVYSRSVIEAAEKQASKSDLLVMGASPRWALRRYDFGPMEDKIAKRVGIPVLMFRKSTQKPNLEESVACGPALGTPQCAFSALVGMRIEGVFRSY